MITDIHYYNTLTHPLPSTHNIPSIHIQKYMIVNGSAIDIRQPERF